MEKIKRVLVVVDMQKGFIVKGMLASHELIKVNPEILRLIREEFNKDGDQVIFTTDAHTENAAEFKRFGNLPHCVKGSEEAEIIDELKKETEGKRVFAKNSTMLYALKEFRDYLEDLKQNHELEEMVFVGILSDMCVFDAAYPIKKHFEQQNMDVRVVVPSNATATYSWPGHDENKMNEIVNIMLNQVGIETPKVYVRK